MLASVAHAQQALPPPLAIDPPSQVPVALQMLRWEMLESEVSSLTFRSMNVLFETRTVPRAGAVWHLPRRDQALDFTYEWEGRAVSADDFLERTYTNALLVMKDGRIVSETYRNNSTPDTRFIGWSMTKSITSVLIGCALAEGEIDSLDTAISDYLPELEGGGYEGVSIRHVMQMRSGVDYPERYDFENPGVAAANHIAALDRNTARIADVAVT
jgi:CubicO group peptidase (beta-lactamase class C family)